MRHMTHSKAPVLKEKMLSPPKGTLREFVSSKLASSSKLNKRKAVKRFVTHVGRP